MGKRHDISVWEFASAITTAAIGLAAMFIGSVLWTDPPVAGVPIVFNDEGGHATATITDLTPLKGEYWIELHMASGAELRAIGVSRQKLLDHVKLSVSYDGGANYLRLLVPQASAYEDEINAPHLLLGSMHNPQSSTALVRVQLQPGVNWPQDMRLVVENDWLTSHDREGWRVTLSQFLLLGGLIVVALAIIAAMLLWTRLRESARRVPAAKISCPEDSKRLRRELENPRR